MNTPSSKDEIEDNAPPERPPSPPLYTTFSARGVHPPTFSAFKPRDYRLPTPQAVNHVAWNCDGKKIAAVGIDKNTRVWYPEKSMEYRSASIFSGGHSDDVDYVSWNPTHPDLFCSSSQRERRVVFWDTRQSRYTQQCSTKSVPVQTNYSPDGRSLLYASPNHHLFFLDLSKEGEETKETWRHSDKEALTGSTAMFNHVGDGVILTHHSEHTLRVLDYPSLKLRESPAAHVGGCVAVALDPRGRYLASGGFDSIVNMFDLNEWICARTITVSEHAINALSFSHDGEYLAIANGGNYIDIVRLFVTSRTPHPPEHHTKCATETGVPLHRVPALAPSPTVSWHPSKYVIAYCGQTKIREGGPPPVGLISMFGLLE
ncbi:hypothetical protein DXG01_012885 [Tephrocybe rancida]|nr:hypothetical protein DXG01_012885 [Tephrocybe rancida]